MNGKQVFALVIPLVVALIAENQTAAAAVANGDDPSFSCAQLSEAEVAAIVDQIGAAHFPQVDRVMVRAMIEIESNRFPCAFRAEPHIGDASIGLMQTLLGVADWLFRDMGATAFGRPTGAELKRPDVSVYFGMANIAFLMRSPKVAALAAQLGGNTERAIVESYNGGPGQSNNQTRNHFEKYVAAKARLA